MEAIDATRSFLGEAWKRRSFVSQWLTVGMQFYVDRIVSGNAVPFRWADYGIMVAASAVFAGFQQ